MSDSQDISSGSSAVEGIPEYGNLPSMTAVDKRLAEYTASLVIARLLEMSQRPETASYFLGFVSKKIDELIGNGVKRLATALFFAFVMGVAATLTVQWNPVEKVLGLFGL